MSICEDLVGEMDDLMRGLYWKLKDRGYLHLYLYNMVLLDDEPPCEWCKDRFRLNDIEQNTRVMYIVHDEGGPVRDYISVKSNIKVKDLTSLVETHPDESCHFVEAQLFKKVYDGEDETIRDRIIERGFHPNFYRQEIIRKYIKSGENPKLYEMVMKHNDLCCITYILKRECSVAELHRYADYLWEMKKRFHNNHSTSVEENPLTISFYEVEGDDPTKIPLVVREDEMDELNLCFDVGALASYSRDRIDADSCYHDGNKIAHCLILAKAYNKYQDIILNITFHNHENFCKCSNRPAIPNYPEENAFYPKSTFKVDL